MKLIARCLPLCVLTLVFAVCASCKSTPKIDWSSRVGTYSYDDAVIELGPPDRTTLISTGRVADWVTGYRSKPRFGFGVGSYGSSGGVGVGTGTDGGQIEELLRLTFDESDKLVTWENTERR